jgi:Mn-containing catalase
MFFHDTILQYNAKPEKPDPLYAKRLQEVLGGQWGEITIMMQYPFQGWNCRFPAKYRDMLLDIGTEEMAHVEMLATMIARLLEGAPVAAQESALKDPVVAAVTGGMNPQHAIVSGLGATPADSVGIARDTTHQNQCIAASAELEESDLEMTPVPSAFPQKLETSEVSYQFWNMSEGTESKNGAWAKGKTPDGKGKFEYLESPKPLGPEAVLEPVNPRTFDTAPEPVTLSVADVAAD